jgi:O-antigen/teichoic acid export membrane protein
MNPSSDSPSLRALAVKSAAWYGATRLWGQGLSWAVTVLLARLLMPSDYGLFAMALSVLGLIEVVQEFGLGTAMVQRKDLSKEQINAVFWVVVGGSTVVTCATALAAGPISRVYGEPGLEWALRILCLTFLLNSLGMVPYALLTRALDLRHRSLAEAIGAATAAVVALGLAWNGFGVWALVGGHLGRAVLLNSALAVFARWRPTVVISLEGMWGILGFGVRILGTHLFGNFLTTTTTFVVARLLGGAAVGLYAMAQSVSEAPHRLSTAIINQVSLPVFSKLQGDRRRLGQYFLAISRYLALISLPVQLGLILVAPDLVSVVFSDKWADMTLPFQLFCVESMVVVQTLTASPLLTARGRANLLLNRSMVSLASLTAAAAIGTLFGLAGVALARVITMVPLRLWNLAVALDELELSMTTYATNMLSPALAGGVMATIVLLVRHGLFQLVSAPERLIASMIVGVVAYPVALLLIDRGLGVEVRTICRELVLSAKG